MYGLSKKFLQQAFDRLATAVVVVDAQGSGLTVAYANSALEQLTGWDVSEILGRRLVDLVVGGDMPVAEDALPGEERSLSQRWNCRDGAVLELTFRLAPLFERPGAPVYWLLSQTPVDAQQSAAGASRRTRSGDNRDAATGLPCRRVFEDVLRRDWGIARREQRAVTLMMFQVEAIDTYRELFGRHSTDACMLKVGHAISGSLRRAGDMVARFASDRFAALISGSSEAQAREFAAQIASKVRTLALPHPRSPTGRYVSVSFGVSSRVPPSDGSTVDVLIDAAEADLADAQAEARRQAS